MATYVVGDIQGCFATLEALLDKAGFGAADTLLCVGDLINRGPDSLAVLRYARGLGERFVGVVGNHDLHFLAMVYGGHPHRPGDTLEDLLAAPDCHELADWLRHRPLLVEGDGWAMAHAGIPHIWDLQTVRTNAREVEAVLRGGAHRRFFETMYGNEPARWQADLVGMARHRAILNYFTRMRLVADDGRMEFAHKGTLDEAPPGYQPWFRYPSRIDRTIYFGHWAALDGRTDNPQAVGLDTGAVWGRTMTAVRLDDCQRVSVPAAARDRPPQRP